MESGCKMSGPLGLAAFPSIFAHLHTLKLQAAPSSIWLMKVVRISN